MRSPNYAALYLRRPWTAVASFVPLEWVSVDRRSCSRSASVDSLLFSARALLTSSGSCSHL